MPLPPALASIMAAIPAGLRTPGGAAGAPPPPGMPGMPAGGAPEMGAAPGDLGQNPFDAAINKKLSESSGVDPEHVVNILREMKATTAALMPKVAFRMSGVDKHLTAAYRSIDSALGEAMKQMQAIAAQKPVDFSGALGAPAAGGSPAPAPPI